MKFHQILCYGINLANVIPCFEVIRFFENINPRLFCCHAQAEAVGCASK